MQQAQAKSVVDIDTRRKVFMAAGARKPTEVAKLAHEAFIRNMLKDSLGWKRDQPAPETIKAVAKEMAAQFTARDKKIADAKQAAKDAAAAKQAAEAAE